MVASRGPSRTRCPGRRPARAGCCSPAPVRVRTGSPPAGRAPAGRPGRTGRSAARACAARRCAAPAAESARARRGSPARAGSGRTPWRRPSDCGDPSTSASSSSRTSPTVTSATTPPLAPTMTAARCSVCVPAAAGRSRSRSHGAAAGRTRRVTGRGHAADQGAPAGHRGQQPAQRGSHQVGADRDRQRLRTIAAGRAWSTRAASCAATARNLAPRRAGGVGPAGQPPVLPGLAGPVAEPVQQRGHPVATPLPAAGAVERERPPVSRSSASLAVQAGARPSRGRARGANRVSRAAVALAAASAAAISTGTPCSSAVAHDVGAHDAGSRTAPPGSRAGSRAPAAG